MHRDNQSSILAITNSAGAVIEKRLFDPWGNILAVQDGAGNNLGKLTFFDRGYTGHEHLQGVGLINMNARLYDPRLHRFLQADNFVQDTSNTQNYNRYAYCVNNPLRYTDPSGNIFGIDDVIICALICAAIGALAGTAVYVGTNLYYGTPITAGGIISSFVMGAISGAVSFGIGEAVSSITQFGVRVAVQALAHGLFQGGMSAIQTGNFASGFISGALSSIACSAWGGGKLAGGDGEWGGIGGNFAKSGAGTLFFGALAGGAGAKLGGGNFWQGAVTGLFVAGMNHLAHMEDGPGDTKKANKLAEEYKSNEEKIQAESMVIEALGETTEPGEILTKVREHVISRYGPEHAKEASETYGKAIEVIKQVKESLGGKKSDVLTYKIMTLLTADVLRSQISNTWIETRVNYLDAAVYNKMTHQIIYHELYSGGGAGGRWK